MPYRIAVLVFLENAAGEHLLLLRAKAPNKGVWSPIGGKLEMATGESPFECAVRETREETGFRIGVADLHLFSVIAEKAYEGQSHWLMFLFRCRRPCPGSPWTSPRAASGSSHGRRWKPFPFRRPTGRRCGPPMTGTGIASWP